MSTDVYRVSYKPMPFLMSEETEIITDELVPVEGETYYIDEGALEQLEEAGMHAEAVKKLRKLVKQSKYGGFDISIST